MSLVFLRVADLQYHPPEWRLSTPLTVRWRANTWTVPVGFTTDLASIPWPVQWLLPVVDRHVYAAILHDYGYEDGWRDLTRTDVDQMFLDAMSAAGVPWWKRNLMWLAVRAAGWTMWGRKP